MLKNTSRIRVLCSAAQNLCLSKPKLLSENGARCSYVFFQQQCRGKKDDVNISSLFIPVPVKAKPNPDDINVGAELTGELNKADLLKVLNKFYQQKEIKQLLGENGLDSRVSIFFNYCFYQKITLQIIYSTKHT